MNTAVQGNISSSSDTVGTGVIITQPVVNFSDGNMTIDNAVSGVDDGSEINSILGHKLADETARKAAESALTKIPAAAVNVLGGIKPLASGSTNRSGLVIDADGTTYVNTNPAYGITRSGDGKIIIAPANYGEVEDGENNYKPVTPLSLKQEFDRRNQYKREHSRLGTWTDGTPMWRVAIDLKLTDEDYEKGYYALTRGDLDVKYIDGINVIANAYLRVNDEIAGAIDSYPVEIDELFRVVLDNSRSKYKHLTGIIEFATASSNIDV